MGFISLQSYGPWLPTYPSVFSRPWLVTGAITLSSRVCPTSQTVARGGYSHLSRALSFCGASQRLYSKASKSHVSRLRAAIHANRQARKHPLTEKHQQDSSFTKQAESESGQDEPQKQSLPVEPLKSMLNPSSLALVVHMTPLQELSTILLDDMPERIYMPGFFEKVYQLWKQVPMKAHEGLRIPVFLLLGRNAWPCPEHIHIIEQIFKETPVTDWNPAVISSAILGQIRSKPSDGLTSAIKIYRQALKHNTIGGLGHIISKLFDKRDFRSLLELALEESYANKRIKGKQFIKTQRLSFRANQTSDAWALVNFRKVIEAHNSDPDSEDRKVLDPLLVCFVDRVVAYGSMEDLKTIVYHVTSAQLLHKVLVYHLARGGSGPQAARLYRRYRQLPIRIPSDILEAMSDYYGRQNNTPGIEEVLIDWRRHYKYLTMLGYISLLKFYAKKGDLRSTELLWNDFVESQKRGMANSNTDRWWGSTFTFMLNVHAERGELADVKRIFRSIKKQNQVCWNILLKAHMIANDYAGAQTTFAQICELFGGPSLSALRVMVKMAAEAGDLDLVSALISNARSAGIPLDMGIMANLIEALCQDEQYQEAEEVAHQAADELEGPAISVYNVLLKHSALGRDLANVSRLIGIISHKNIKYNAVTYTWLLRGLAFCRQTPDAYRLLLAMFKDDPRTPTPEHFSIVLSSALSTDEPHIAMRVLDMMKSPTAPTTISQTFAEVSVLKKWNKFRPPLSDRVSNSKLLSEVLQMFHRAIARLEAKEVVTSKKQLVSPQDVERIVSLGVILRQFGPVRQLLQAFMAVYPPKMYPEKYTYHFLNALLIADVGEGNFQGVDITWSILLSQMREFSRVHTSKAGRLQKGQLVIRSIQPAIGTMMKSCFYRNQPQRLKSIVKVVRDMGFELNNSNWNLYVQYLARMEQYVDAFSLCEKVLMPGFVGWHRRAVANPAGNPNLGVKRSFSVPLAMRQRMTDPRYLNPTKHTILVLSKTLMDLLMAARVSTSMTQLLNVVQAAGPHVLTAIQGLGELQASETRFLKQPNFYAKSIVTKTKKNGIATQHPTHPFAQWDPSVDTLHDTRDFTGAVSVKTQASTSGVYPKIPSVLQNALSRSTQDTDRDHKGDLGVQSLVGESSPASHADTVNLSHLTGGQDDWKAINAAIQDSFDDEGRAQWTPDESTDEESLKYKVRPMDDTSK